MKKQIRKILWMVNVAHPFTKITINEKPLVVNKGDPQRFAPIFDTKKQAIAWRGKSRHRIKKITITSKLSK